MTTVLEQAHFKNHEFKLLRLLEVRGGGDSLIKFCEDVCPLKDATHTDEAAVVSTSSASLCPLSVGWTSHEHDRSLHPASEDLTPLSIAAGLRGRLWCSDEVGSAERLGDDLVDSLGLYSLLLRRGEMASPAEAEPPEPSELMKEPLS